MNLMMSLRPTLSIPFLFALAIALAPSAAESQNSAARIGLLGPDEEPRFSEIASGLKRGLQEQGYRENMVHLVEGRVRRGDEGGARAAVQALAAQRVWWRALPVPAGT